MKEKWSSRPHQGRFISAALDNRGTITARSSTGLTLDRNSTTYTNAGLITLTAGDLGISGTAPTLTNTAAGTLTIGAARPPRVR